jgi:hypothetical protein
MPIDRAARDCQCSHGIQMAVDAHWTGLIHSLPEYLYSGIRGG